jgi:hypothetical protein
MLAPFSGGPSQASNTTAPTAATGSPVANSPRGNIDTLEYKFFEHTYPTDPLNKRIDRIEKFVFGGSTKGSDQQRLAHLLTVVPINHASASKSSTKSGTTSGAAARPVSSGFSNSTDYPAVTSLENEILGSAHRDEPIRSRLERLESKAFGRPSIGTDLSSRVSELQNYANDQGLTPKTHDHYAVAHYVPPPSNDAKIEAKIDWLEQQVYGRSVPDRSVFERVRRLNISVLPNESISLDESIPQNVNTLISAVELDQTSKIVDAADNDPSTPAEHSYKPLPPEIDFRGRARKAKLNSTAARLQDAGMPSPIDSLKKPAQLASTSDDDDPSSLDSRAEKNKNKKHGFWSMLKESIQETSEDRSPVFGIPSSAFGQ